MGRTQRARRPRQREPEEVEQYPRPDRWAWAQAILNGAITVGLDGIHDEDGNRYRGKYAPIRDAESLGKALTRSGAYMEAYAEREIEYYRSSDCDDSWEEHCQEVAERDGLDAEELKELQKSWGKRYDWAYERWDPEWAWDQIKNDCTEVGFIYDLLKKYPVAAIQPNRDSVFFELDDIIAFCHECDFTLDKHDLREGVIADEAVLGCPPHRFNLNCAKCGPNVSCAFDRNKKPRSFLRCCNCNSYVFHKDQLDAELRKDKRPLTWPPGVPLRQNFAGGPDFAPPWEE